MSNEISFIPVTFSLEEIKDLAVLLDVSVKATGLQGAKTALPLLQKLEQALESASNKNSEDSQTIDAL